LGWVAGVGVEVPIAGNWTAKAEYLYTGYGSKGFTFPTAMEGFSSNLAMQSIQLGLNYKIGDSGQISDFLIKGPSALETDRFAFHAQATYLNQYSAPFTAPYKGTNSLAPNIGRETSDFTLFAGVRLWQGAEAWVNPEIDQGFGLSGSVGVAGFPSGEAYKSGPTIPTPVCIGRSCDRPSTSVATPRKSTLGSTSFRERKRRIGWCSRSEKSTLSTFSIPTDTPTTRAGIS
jgi:high affinity Mn2+ porin